MTAQIPATELLDHADQLVTADQQRAHLNSVLLAAAEGLRLGRGVPVDAIPAAAAAVHDTARNLRWQLTASKATVRDLHGQLATAHGALRNLAQAYADTTTAYATATLARPDADDLAPWIRRAIGDPGSIVGYRRGPHWPEGHEGWAEQAESVTAWSTRAVLTALATDGRPHCERCEQVIRVDDAYEPPLPGVGLWEHAGTCPPLVAEQGCDDCSVEPGERHRYAHCPGNQRQIARTTTTRATA